MERPDLRMALLGLAAWGGALTVGFVAWLWVAAAGVATGILTTAYARRLGLRRTLTVLGVLLVLVGVATVGELRQEQVRHNPVAALARERAAATLVLTVTSDPRPLAGLFGDRVLIRGRVLEVTGRGTGHVLRTPVLLVADPSWSTIRLGTRVRATGRLGPATGQDLAALVSVRGEPEMVAAPGVLWRGADAVRQSLRDSVSHRPDSQRALVPALVDGDDVGLEPELAEDFRTTGLSHLLAVSGTNLTLVVGFLLVLARWCGVRGRWLYLVGAAGIAGFVLLARTEPSVLRAAAMGSVALLAMGTDGRQRGTRALGVAVVVLLLVEPGLARSAGFALSVVATAGILLLAPGWRDALQRWLPRWFAEAVSIPAAAQLACTPLVAAISGQVSLVAVAANLAVAPVVGPATVLGLAGGLAGLVSAGLGAAFGTLASWCVAWIVLVARRGADLPTAAVEWSTGALSLTVLVVICAVVALATPWLLRHPATGIGCCVLLVVVVLVRPPSPGWPPPGWVLAACDVGQGDALVLRAGPGSGVVVDAGPDPARVDACLDRLDIRRVPLVVLTHFHADHVDGLSGVLAGRTVEAIEVSRLADPPDGVALVEQVAGRAGLVPRPSPYAATRDIGEVRVQVLGPLPGSPTVGPGDGSTANDASVVLLAEVSGVRILLTGDIEPEAQGVLARAWPGLRVDVLKVPHHGSRHQDLAFLAGLGARLAVVSVGADNDYGHPATEVLGPLADTGARVLRTDRDGDVAVVVRDGELLAATRE